MDVQLQQALQSLPGESVPLTEEVKKLGQLVDSDLPLQSFLEQLLPQLCHVFSGDAAVAWMKAAGTSDAVFGVRYRMEELLGTIAEQKKHERLVQFAWQQKQPLLAEPAVLVKGQSKPGSVNPTDFPLLFGPIVHYGEVIALLEIVLPKGQTVLNTNQRQLYLRSAQLVAERIYGGLRRRMAMPVATLGRAVEQLESLTGEVSSLQLQIRQSIENRLQQFHGWSFASFAENQAFAKLVHQILESHGLRVACPECGHASILRCMRVGNAKHGAFVFDHYLDSGRTFHGGPTTVPLIRLVSKPARRPALGNLA